MPIYLCFNDDDQIIIDKVVKKIGAHSLIPINQFFGTSVSMIFLKEQVCPDCFRIRSEWSRIKSRCRIHYFAVITRSESKLYRTFHLIFFWIPFTVESQTMKIVIGGKFLPKASLNRFLILRSETFLNDSMSLDFSVWLWKGSSTISSNKSLIRFKLYKFSSKGKINRRSQILTRHI